MNEPIYLLPSEQFLVNSLQDRISVRDHGILEEFANLQTSRDHLINKLRKVFPASAESLIDDILSISEVVKNS